VRATCAKPPVSRSTTGPPCDCQPRARAALVAVVAVEGAGVISQQIRHFFDSGAAFEEQGETALWRSR